MATTKRCGACGAVKEQNEFSKKQWSAKSWRRRCKDCIASDAPLDEANAGFGGIGGAAAAPPPPQLRIAKDQSGKETVRVVPPFGAKNTSFFVSEGLQNRVCVGEDGVAVLNLEDDSDYESDEVDVNCKRGKCANPSCPSSPDEPGFKLMRCGGCWLVDYCSKECQKNDRRRHKKAECKKAAPEQGKDQKVPSKMGSGGEKEKRVTWQALANLGTRNLAKSKYSKAARLLQQAIDAAPFEAASVYVDLATAELKLGKTESALRHCYRACELDPGLSMGFVMKTECHLALGQVAAAAFTIYSCYQSMDLRFSPHSDRSVEETHIMPLFKKSLQLFIDEYVQSHGFINPGDLPLKTTLLQSVPFTINLCPDSGVSFMQERSGIGWEEVLPAASAGFSAFPHLAYHSAVLCNDGRTVLIFGGTNGEDESNAVFLVRLDVSDSSRYELTLQHCTGDTPPPVQGHSACVVGCSMYIFGGACYNPLSGCSDVPLEDVFVLDMKTWNWRKMSSLANTPESQRPEAVVFGSFTPLDDDAILFVGGRRVVPYTKDKHGIVRYGQGVSVTSQNMHVYSIAAEKWSLAECSGDEPRVWGHSAHRKGKNELILFGGNKESKPVNALYFLDARGKFFRWSKIQPCTDGVPPSLSNYRAVVYLRKVDRLLVHGGYYHRLTLTDSVFRPGGCDAHDGKSLLVHDAEIYRFDLKSRQWSRLRVPTAHGRMGHQIVVCPSTNSSSSNVLLMLGGCHISEGESGATDGRKYCGEVLRFELRT